MEREHKNSKEIEKFNRRSDALLMVKELPNLMRILNSQYQLRVTIEGNIGSGKTTILNHLAKLVSFGNMNVLILREPLEKWNNLNGVNLLQKMYEDPKNWATRFQYYAMTTMIENHLKSNQQNVTILERSMWSSKFCFVEAHKKLKSLNEIDYGILNEWFDVFTKKMQIENDLVIYIQTDPETCLNRSKLRRRFEEKTLNIEYLRLIHNLHEAWLIKGEFPIIGHLITIDGNKNTGEMMTEIDAKLKSFSIQKF